MSYFAKADQLENYTESQVYLGLIYEQGFGLSINPDQALM